MKKTGTGIGHDNKNPSLLFLGSFGYGLGGIFGSIFLKTVSIISEHIPDFEFVLAYVYILTAAAIMGLTGGLILGTSFKNRNKMWQFAICSALSGMVIVVPLLLQIPSELAATFIFICLSISAFLTAASFLYVQTHDLKKSLIFGLYGLFAGIIGCIATFLIIVFFLGPLLQSNVIFFISNVIFLAPPLFGFFTGGLLGYFIERDLANRMAVIVE